MPDELRTEVHDTLQEAGIKTIPMAFSGYRGVGNREQQSLPRHPPRGGVGSPAWEPAQAQQVFGDCGASDQPEEL